MVADNNKGLLHIITKSKLCTNSRLEMQTMPIHQSIIDSIANNTMNNILIDSIKQALEEASSESEEIKDNKNIFHIGIVDLDKETIEKILDSVAGISSLGKVKEIFKFFNVRFITDKYFDSKWIDIDHQFFVINDLRELLTWKGAHNILHFVDSQEKYCYYKDNINKIVQIFNSAEISRLEVMMIYDRIVIEDQNFRKEKRSYIYTSDLGRKIVTQNFDDIIAFEVV